MQNPSPNPSLYILVCLYKPTIGLVVTVISWWLNQYTVSLFIRSIWRLFAYAFHKVYISRIHEPTTVKKYAQRSQRRKAISLSVSNPHRFKNLEKKQLKKVMGCADRYIDIHTIQDIQHQEHSMQQLSANMDLRGFY